MKRASRSIAALSLGALVGLSTGRAGAEAFIDVYGGASISEDGEVDTKLEVEAISESATASDDLDFDTAPVIGIRAGYWFPDFSFFGLALDASYFLLDGPSASASEVVDGTEIEVNADFDVHVFPLTPLLMFRTKVLMIPGTRGPGLQPYLAAGPGIFVSYVDSTLDVRIDDVEDSFEAVGVEVGADARAGLKLHLTRWLTLFTEYRFTYFEPEFEDDLFDDVLSVEQDAELTTHHLVAGLGFHF